MALLALLGVMTAAASASYSKLPAPVDHGPDVQRWVGRSVDELLAAYDAAAFAAERRYDGKLLIFTRVDNDAERLLLLARGGDAELAALPAGRHCRLRFAVDTGGRIAAAGLQPRGGGPAHSCAGLVRLP